MLKRKVSARVTGTISYTNKIALNDVFSMPLTKKERKKSSILTSFEVIENIEGDASTHYKMKKFISFAYIRIGRISSPYSPETSSCMYTESLTD